MYFKRYKSLKMTQKRDRGNIRMTSQIRLVIVFPIVFCQLKLLFGRVKVYRVLINSKQENFTNIIK